MSTFRLYYRIPESTPPCLSICVSRSVLTTLVKNEVFPDPFYGINSQHIPDIGAVGREYYTYWFCKELDIPQVPLYLRYRTTAGI